MKNDEGTSFFDTRTLVAIVLVGLTFIGWQAYMQRKYPDLYNKKAAVTQTAAGVPASPGVNAATGAKDVTGLPAASDGKINSPETPAAEMLTSFTSDNLAFDISSRGMGVKGFKILHYKDREGQTVVLGQIGDQAQALETRLLGHPEPLDFKVEKINPNLFVGHAHSGGMQITKTMDIDPDKYMLTFKVVASGTDEKFLGLTTSLVEELEPAAKKTFLMPQFQKQEFFIETTDSKDRVVFAKEDQQKSWLGVKIASLGSQYFTQAILDRSNIIPEARGLLNHGAKTAGITLQYPVLNRAQDFELNYLAYVGPKSHALLHSIDESLALVVDFGFFNWIGRHILVLLKWLYGLVGNWGLAVIGLTLMVRLLVLPLNIYSYKSMKVMQKLQPQIQALREKYKDDQQKQQQEMMALMKSNKANPLAGCMPVLLQFPIFIALYQVLGNSIELYQAPFGLWIHDLSLKDPFYILPVLMGVTMFVQQKITPNTMDPAQAKVLLMMPLIFTFFMISLPSGLTLYMLVGAVFSVCQQMYFLKQSKA